MPGREEVIRRVHQALEYEPRVNLHLHPVRIGYTGGAVVLEGEVGDVATKKLALELAASPRPPTEIPVLPPEPELPTPVEIPAPLPEAQPEIVPEIPPPLPEVSPPPEPEMAPSRLRSRSYGHAHSEIWPALEWQRFKEMVHKLPAT